MPPFLGSVVRLGLDDTLARQRGVKMFGTGRHHDSLLYSRNQVVTSWGHSRVVLGVIIELPFRRGHDDCLPILFRLYLNKKSAAKHRRAYRTRPELAVEMQELLCHHRKNQRFHVIADSAYGGQNVLCYWPTNCDLTSRLVKNARLYGPRAPRTAGTNGRPRQRGQQLPTPQAMLAGRCRRVTLEIYGRREEARLADQVAHVYAAPERPLCVVATEAVRDGRGQEVSVLFHLLGRDRRTGDWLVRDAVELLRMGRRPPRPRLVRSRPRPARNAEPRGRYRALGNRRQTPTATPRQQSRPVPAATIGMIEYNPAMNPVELTRP
ncbi:MAG: hypothetical protein HZA46_15285 [Planctomycetales bacterium]|nr:hypothetical protein [Planctomycetales bacterium]